MVISKRNPNSVLIVLKISDLFKIMEKASKSHRQRVEEFNAKLDNLSEHYDIPKVSWTK